MTDLYLAFSINHNAAAAVRDTDWTVNDLGLLVSFFYLRQFMRAMGNQVPNARRTMLDSGAFSAWNSGKTIDMDALVAEGRSGRWEEVVALDVIGDAHASLKNALYMKTKGSNCFPVFHVGEPWEILSEYCRQFSKVGLSCRFGESEKDSYRWLDNCFARAYPHKFHSFGWVKEEMLMRYPFETADASSWAVASTAYKRWSAYGGRMPLKGTFSLQPEIEYYARMQKRLKHRWKKERQKLETQVPCAR